MDQILALVSLNLNDMVDKRDSVSKSLKQLGEKTLGHKGEPTEDKLVSNVTVNL